MDTPVRPERICRDDPPPRVSNCRFAALCVCLWFGWVPIPINGQDPIVATPVFSEAKQKKSWQKKSGSGLFKKSKKRPANASSNLIARPVEPIAKSAVVEVAKYQRVPSTDNSLSGLIREALANNHELHSARQDEIIQLAKASSLGKNGLPKFELYHTRASQPHAFANQGGRTSRDAVGLTVEQPLFDFGAGKNALNIERSKAGIEKWSAKDKELETVYNVKETYWRVVLFNEIISLRAAALAAKKREALSVGERVMAREARRAELLLVQAERAQAEQDLLAAENGRALAVAQLQFYVGRDMGGNIAINDRLTLSSSDKSRTVCIESHPKMKQLRMAQQAAADGERAARLGRLPTLSVRGHIEDSHSRQTLGTTNLVPDGTNYQIDANVDLPIGRHWAVSNKRIDQATATKVQLAADAKALNGAIQLKVMAAQNRVEEARKSVIVAEKQETAAAENLKLRMELASIKSATKADIGKAQSSYQNAKVGVLKAKYDVKEALANLDRELGVTCK